MTVVPSDRGKNQSSMTKRRERALKICLAVLAIALAVPVIAVVVVALIRRLHSAA